MVAAPGAAAAEVGAGRPDLAVHRRGQRGARRWRVLPVAGGGCVRAGQRRLGGWAGVAVGRAATPCRRASPRRRCPAARRTQQLTPPAWVGWPSNSQSRPTGGAGQRLDPRPDGHPGHGEAVAMRRPTWTVPNGCGLTTVVAHNAFLALFPLLLVVVTVLGFLLGRDSGFQQRVLGSAVAEFPIIGDQVQRNIHGLRGNGVGLVVGLLAFAWGARGLTQVAQHAMAEIWDIPSRQRPPLLGPAGPRAAAAPGFRRWPCRVEPADLAWQLRRAGSRGSTSQPRGRGGGERRAVPADVPGTYPSADPNPAADRWCAGRWCRLAGPAGRWWIPRRPLPAPRQRGLWVVRDRPWPAVLVIPGRAAHPVRRGSQRRGRATALAAQPAAGRRLSVSRAQPGQHRRRLALGDPERGPRGPSQGRAVSLTVARRGDHSGRMEKLSLEALARELMKSANAAPAGRSARTVYGGHEHVLRQTLMALTAGSSMSEHENPGEATMHVLHGRVRLVADTTEWEGRDGDLLIVPQARHTLHALEDAAVLLTVAKLP